jgi:Cyclophilin type peptidyl-prolyl cis-trans isomerase/CLD
MDETHHVVGRVHLGMPVLEQLQEVQTDAFETPNPPLIIVACGPTNSEGDPCKAVSGTAMRFALSAQWRHVLRLAGT